MLSFVIISNAEQTHYYVKHVYDKSAMIHQPMIIDT